MIEVFLLRHGQTDWNADNNRYCGRTDLSLTPFGIEQANKVREQLKGYRFSGVYSSPLKRAYQTAQIISPQIVIKDERLIELDFGSWEGKTKQEFINENSILWEDWMRDPFSYKAGGTGESGEDALKRVNGFFTDLMRKSLNDERFLIVAHNGLNRLFLAYKLGMPLKNYRQLTLDNSTITQFTLDENGLLTLNKLNSIIQTV